MNCRDTEQLLQAERDGALPDNRRADLERHLAECPACREFRSRLSQVSEFVRSEAAGVRVPDADAEWRRLQVRMHGDEVRLPRKRRLAPVYWLGAPIAAAAALALALLSPSRVPPGGATDTAGDAPALVATLAIGPDDAPASAEYVEFANTDASPMIYVDKESGWLVVWAVDAKVKSSG